MERYTNGNEREITYVDGQIHGTLVVRRADGSQSEIPYVNEEVHGMLIERDSNGTALETPYVNGQKHGTGGYKVDGRGRDRNPLGAWTDTRHSRYEVGRRQGDRNSLRQRKTAGARIRGRPTITAGT